MHTTSVYSSREKNQKINSEKPGSKVLFTDQFFTIKIAANEEEIDAALKLRFEVFNLELNEGLSESFLTFRDRDPFDDQCDHLLIIDNRTRETVGTYRMQTKEMADKGIGFYSNGEFQLDMLPPAIPENAVELGRACVARNYRNSKVLFMLWRGIANYLFFSGKRYLFGCSSLTSQDEAEGIAFYHWLHEKGYVERSVNLLPQPGFELDGENWRGVAVPAVPPLMKIYLRYGVKVIGLPAIDREFKTIDYLVLLDKESLSPEVLRMFVG